MEKGEPQILSLKMKGFDEDEFVKREMREKTSSSEDRDSPDSTPRYSRVLSGTAVYTQVQQGTPRVQQGTPRVQQGTPRVQQGTPRYSRVHPGTAGYCTVVNQGEVPL